MGYHKALKQLGDHLQPAVHERGPRDVPALQKALYTYD